FAIARPVKIGGNHTDLCRDASGAALVDFARRLLVHLPIIKPEHRDGGAHHIHRAGGFRRSLDEVNYPARQLPLSAQLLHKSIDLLAIRQLSLPKEVNDFLETDFAGQLVDVVAGVDQLPFVTDDIAQARAVCDNSFQTFCSDRHRLTSSLSWQKSMCLPSSLAYRRPQC